MLSMLALVSVAASAQEIYKHVDADGNVTYSNVPPDSEGSTETLDTVVEPDQEDIDAARARQEKIEEDLDEKAQARAEAAEREAQAQQSSGSSTIVVNQSPIIGGYYYDPHRYDWRWKDRYPRKRPRPVPYK